MASLVARCRDDAVFDAASVKPFNIKLAHAMRQEYGQTARRRCVALFWSEYVGIEQQKLNTAKRLEQ